MLKTSTVSLQYVSVLSSLLRTEQLLWKKNTQTSAPHYILVPKEISPIEWLFTKKNPFQKNNPKYA